MLGFSVLIVAVCFGACQAAADHASALDLSDCFSNSSSSDYLSIVSDLGSQNGYEGVPVRETLVNIQKSLLVATQKLEAKEITYNYDCMLSKFYYHVCNNAMDEHKAGSFPVCALYPKSDAKTGPQDIDGYTWMYAILSVTAISLCSLMGISVLPILKKPIYNKILLYLISLSVGSLAGNAIFHLLPHGFGLGCGPETVALCSMVAGGLYVFYFIEGLLENLFKSKHTHISEKSCMSPGYTATEGCCETSLTESPVGSEKVIALIPPSCDGDDCHTRRERRKFLDLEGVKPIAWMITVADAIHNFMDGLAIGASYAVSPIRGFSTSLAIFCEELPHELGDFAILLKAGMSLRQAACFNFASACCCFVGLIVGLLLGTTLAASNWIFALTGGIFLYVSLAGMLPEARAHSLNPELAHRPWLCFVLQNVGLLTGFVAMFLLSYYEDSFKMS